MEKYWEYDKEMWQGFVDFKQAYDSIHRPSMWNIMAEFGIPVKLINLVKTCYRDSKSCVQVGKKKTECFDINSGLRQGCLLSPMLFNLILEKVKRSMEEVRGGVNLGDVNVKVLAFADDVDITGPDIQHIERLYVPFKETASRTGLEVNQNKTKIMRLARDNRQQQQQQQQNMVDIEQVSEFKYLGSMLTSRNEMEREVLTRIAAANRCFTAFSIL